MGAPGMPVFVFKNQLTIKGTAMQRNQQKKERIIRSGQIVVLLSGPEGTGKIIALTESRGCQSNFNQKTYYYFVWADGYQGITKDARRKTLLAFWNKNQIIPTIINQELWEKFLN